MVSFARRGEGSDQNKGGNEVRRVRPHSSLGYFTPNEFMARGARSGPAMQRAGAQQYVGLPRPSPLLNSPLGDKSSKQGKPSQANRGPTKPARPGPPTAPTPSGYLSLPWCEPIYLRRAGHLATAEQLDAEQEEQEPETVPHCGFPKSLHFRAENLDDLLSPV
jgi:hypothetical protein